MKNIGRVAASLTGAAAFALMAPAGAAGSTFTLHSQAFAAQTPIPVRYTCDGASVSPPLTWGGAPAARTWALIVDDPDTSHGTHVHAVIYNLPAAAHALPAGLIAATLPQGARFGVNGRGQPAYTGPCPPSGVHHYHFKLYALDTRLPDQGHLDKAALLKAMQGHIVGMAELVGTYRRH